MSTVRARLTALYVGLFLASTATVLIVTYLLVATQNSTSITTTNGSLSITTGSCSQLNNPVPPTPGVVQDCVGAARDQLLNRLLVVSGATLGVMAVASVGLGWLMAGRVLRPLRAITATARRISAHNLHERIAISGPGDELKELGDTFDALLTRLEATFDAQRLFVANASHELRTPLARQRTLLEVAMRDPRADADSLRAACERAVAAGEQSERLIEALLTLARGERGLDRLEPLDLGELTRETLAARTLPEGVTLTADCRAAPGLGDERLAVRMIANLTDNALRHNIPGGRVEVTTGTHHGRGFLRVRNTGPLVPADQLARLFEPFQRLDDSRPVQRDGAGLGLAIVRSVASAHGATVHASALPDGGLDVEVVLPSVL